MAVTITQHCELTTDDIDFTHRCSITQLTVKHTPQDTDEDQLIGILQKSPKLKELCIGCLGERSLAIIKLISAREKTLQSRGNSALYPFKLMDKGLEPSDLPRTRDELDHVTSKVSFTRDSGTPVMDTCLNLQCEKLVTGESMVSKFFRQYGWSISSLDAHGLLLIILQQSWTMSRRFMTPDLLHLYFRLPCSQPMDWMPWIALSSDRKTWHASGYSLGCLVPDFCVPHP